MSVILQRLADNDPRFEDYSDETCPLRPGELGEEHHDGHWLYTAPGWKWDGDPWNALHQIHEWTVKAVLAEVRNVVPCRCDSCLESLGHKGAVIRTCDQGACPRTARPSGDRCFTHSQQLHEGNQS